MDTITAETVPLEELAEVIAFDAQIKTCLIQLGEIEVQAEEQKNQIKSQLGDIRRKQGMEHARLMRRFNIIEGSKIDFATGKITAPEATP